VSRFARQNLVLYFSESICVTFVLLYLENLLWQFLFY
jgi:hypothetical protein